ncbi:MAG: SLOG family protein, partial [Dysosmobacter sp.]|nr:SLOG family protein [Dysosmobacter sp.]
MADLRQRTCCFTGHRVIPEKDLPGILERTERAVRRLIEHGVVFFGVGGAIGYDTEAAKLLFRLRTTDYPQIKVILVYPFEGFTSRWNDGQRAEYAARLLPQYDKTVCVAQRASREAYLERDRHLVDGSAYCIAYCTRNRGGTAYTLRYA